MNETNEAKSSGANTEDFSSLMRALLRRRREERGLSARAVSEMAGLSPSYVNKVESGEVQPSLRTFGKIITALDLNDLEVALLCRLAAQ